MNIPDPTREDVTIRVFPPSEQGRGAFDGGRITERKPIGFPGEGSKQTRIGPLFYWAWAEAAGYGKIGLHPHQGFEIMSYVLSGELGHYDTLGNRSRVGAGGAQVMQTGSGVMHEEETVGEKTAFFQIWFEPHLREALLRAPTYGEYRADAFPVTEEGGVRRKRILGPGAPITLVADARMEDVTAAPGQAYRYRLEAGRRLAGVILAGSGAGEAAGGDPAPVMAHDFAVAAADEAATLVLSAGPDEPLRMVLIDVPAAVDYPLYPAR